MRSLSTSAAVILIAGLGTTVLSAQALPGFSLINERPADEDRPRFLSTNAWSCEFGIRVLSDEGRAFDRVTRLQGAMRSELGARLDGHTVHLRSYQVYFNGAAQMMDVVDAVVAGSIGATSGGSRRLAPKCSKDKTPDGWFDPRELENDNPPIITEIEAVVDGTPISLRSVYSPSIHLRTPPTAFGSKARKNFADEEAGPEVEKAISKANLAFVEQVAKLM